MGARVVTEKGFVDYFLEQKVNPQSFLAKVNRLVDWHPFEEYLAKHLKRGSAAAGQPPYPDLVMFKVLLLQFLYDLSDDALSYALSNNIAFIVFIGLPFESSTPDGSTIGRFRNSLLKDEHYRNLLNLFNQQLEKNGLIKKSEVAVDATVVASSRRPRKKVDLEIAAHDRHEDEVPLKKQNDTDTELSAGNEANVDTEKTKVTVTYSDDKDATWTVKGGKPQYGYKVHAACETDNGFIVGGHVTGANVADTNEFAKVVTESDLAADAVVYADKGYTSKANREYLKENNFIDGIMHKEVRGRKLTVGEKFLNGLISQVRWVVERSFGTLKQVQGFVRSRYLGREKVDMEFNLHALAHNLKKAINLSI